MGTAVAAECDLKSRAFRGEINRVELKLGEDDHGLLLDPEAVVRVAMALGSH